MNAIVHVGGLTKVYGSIKAVDDISFNVHDGEIFGIVGPNGAGKTTTVECLEGLRKPDAGSLSVLGVDPRTERKFLRLHTGIQLQQSNLPDRMRVWEALDLYSSFYPKPMDWKQLLQQLGLEEKCNTPFAKLSGGQKQRLFIALALLPDPQLIFLDELITGLDPQARHTIWDLIRDVQNQGKTIIMTTHFMEEAERLCDRITIMDHGRIIALDTPTALIDRLGAEERVIFTIDGTLPEGFEKLFSREINFECEQNRIIIHSSGSHDSPLVSEVVNVLSQNSIAFQNLRTEQPNLEDVFLKLTGNKIRE